MELKLRIPVVKIVDGEVLIEPLWNWNMVLPTEPTVPKAGINRTFMELKPGTEIIAKLVRTGINRTFMELKQRC